METLGPEAWQAVRLSLKVAFWATLAAMPLGVAVAYLLARVRFPGRGRAFSLVAGARGLPFFGVPLLRDEPSSVASSRSAQ